MGFIEKLLPDTIPLTEEQFKTFVEQTIATEHTRRVLDGLTAQNAATAPAQGVGTNAPLTAKTAHTAQEDGADGSAVQGVTGLRNEAGRGTTLPPASLGVTAQYQWKSSLVYAIMRSRYHTN